MLKLTNLSTADSDLQRFSDAEDVRSFLSSHQMDGLELLLYEPSDLHVLPSDKIHGVHLGYFPSWLPLYLGDEEKLIAEFGTLADAYAYYGTDTKNGLIEHFRKQLDIASALGARYTVFHVAEVSLQETLDYRFHYADEFVIDCAVSLINEVLRDRNDSFGFLVENLWWPGFRFTSPSLTSRLMQGIQAPNKGIMLDIGHLMHTNIDLVTLEDAAAYIHRQLDTHGELYQHIKGIHLHQSLSGQYVKNMLSQNITLQGSYMERLFASYGHIMHIDTHRPFLSKSMIHIIERIQPEYLVYELITTSLEDHAQCIDAQNIVLQ